MGFSHDYHPARRLTHTTIVAIGATRSGYILGNEWVSNPDFCGIFMTEAIRTETHKGDHTYGSPTELN